ncbi:hypothetical protein RUND412_010979 [Rhizina undulata]
MLASIFTTALAATIPLLASALPATPDYLLPRGTSPRDLAARSPISDCLQGAGVPFLISTSTGYDQERKPFNLRFNYSPAAAALPTTNAQVASAVNCARKTNTKVVARSGGHSYAAFGIGGVDGSLMVDLVGFQQVSVDPTTKVATVGGGVRLGNLATQIFNQAGRGLPHGTCPGVGIGGHALHGGFGLDSRLWGLTLDMIVEMTAVLSNGNIVTVSATQNTDLYWALRGAGPSFAIVTQFKLTTFAAPSQNYWYTYSWTFDVATSAKAFLACQSFGANTAPKELGFGVVLGAGGSFTIRGIYYGSEAQYKVVIAPLMAQLQALNGGSPPSSSTEKMYGWLDSLVVLAGEPLATSTQPIYGYDAHDTFFAKSLVTPSSTLLTEAALVNFFTYLKNVGTSYKNPWFIIANLYGGPGSVINIPPPSTDPKSTSSYAHRDSLFVFQFYANMPNNLPPFDEGILPFLGNMVNSIISKMPGVFFAAYNNYVDPTFKIATAYTLYYGDGYPRLKNIKRAVDPGFVFWYPQVIGRTTS